ADQLGGRGGGALGGARVHGPVEADLVGGAGVPADADPRPAPVGFGQQGGVGDEGAQQPFAGFVAGGGGGPEGGQVGGQCPQRVGVGWGWQLLAGVGEGGLGVGERGEPGLPAGLQGAGDQPVLRFGGVEGPFGAVVVVAGAFGGQFGGADAPAVAVGDLA